MKMGMWRRRVVLTAAVALCGAWATDWPGAASQQGSAPAPRIRINPLVEALEQGKVAEDGANTPGGVWTFIDMEHGRVPTLTQVQERFASMAVQRKPNGQLVSAPVVRVPMYGDESPRWLVKQILDSGGLGIIFPQIDSREQAPRAVPPMRYPPQRGSNHPTPIGTRGFGFSGNHPMWFVDGKPVGAVEYMKRADVWPLNPDGELFAA